MEKVNTFLLTVGLLFLVPCLGAIIYGLFLGDNNE